uniref:Uncharacterized protein n=1 Tax=Timema poppense TaxID=170557 RepID=A0A7R9DW77_TIMPO|nr:unnamed protein product [Timema poppensis]
MLEENAPSIEITDNSDVAEYSEESNKNEMQHQNTATDISTPSKSFRKVSNPFKWNCNIRKNNHQSGKACISKRDENEITQMVIWSGLCVPQNRYSIMANAVLYFLRETPQLNSVTMKYSVPEQSCVQEVDNAHSAIEKIMPNVDPPPHWVLYVY